MDREIKFCGKGVETDEWVYGNLIICKNKDVFIDTLMGEDGQWTKVIPKTVGQFTGFKGKYEGNIVKWTSLYIEGEAIGEITFFEGCWFIQGDKHNGRLADCLTCEVIGTVHDNPELLKAGDTT